MRNAQITNLVYKHKQSMIPPVFNINESHDYNTRSSTSGDIKLANPSNNQLMRTFKYNSAKLWNTLAIYVRGNPPK